MMNDLTLDSICDITLYQRKGGYRFSIDSILLAGFIKVPKGIKFIADLGAGSGVIGLILAKRCHWIKVNLIEIQDSLIALSDKNITINNLRERVSVIRADISFIHKGKYHELHEGLYDAIVTNPPFRRAGAGKISPYNERATARHEIKLNVTALLRSSAYLLRNKGRLFMIYHPSRLNELIGVMRSYSLEPKRMKFVHSDLGKEANMVLIEIIKGGGVELKIEPPLVLYNEDRQYTKEVLSFLRK